MWGSLFHNRRILVFIDNESARLALIRGWSASRPSNELLRRFALIQAKMLAHLWFARVPSKSNPADGPSGLSFESAREKFGADV
eukprot:2477997-Amphidinium_carterae.1